MLSLTTVQRDLLLLLLAAEAPIGAGTLGERLHLSARQIHYGLRDIDGWLNRRKASVRYLPGLGVQIVCAPEQRQQFQAELAAQSRFQLILAPEQRQQLLALTLLAAHEPQVLTQIQQDMAVARSTVLKDLETVEPWFDSFTLTIARRQHRGCWVEGSEFARRQALAALTWGDVPFERTILHVEPEAGVVFALAQDAQLLPLVAHADSVIRAWDCHTVQPVIEAAEAALGGRYTDEAVLALQLALAIQLQRVQAEQHVAWEQANAGWIAQQPVWPIAARIAANLWPELSPDVRAAEAAALALSLLCGARDEVWNHSRVTGTAFPMLIDSLLHESVQRFESPEIAHDQLLRDGLEALLLPACVRKQYAVWSPPRPASDAQAEFYASERDLADRFALRVQAQLGVGLPPDAVDELTFLLHAAVLRRHAEQERRVFVVCPSGMATTQVLLARLKLRFPRLGTFEVWPLRELTAAHVAAADLIITTVPLTAVWAEQVTVIHVHPMLQPKDIAALTQWMAQN